MKIGLLPIVSSLHDQKQVNESTNKFINAISNKLGQDLNVIDFKNKDEYDLVLIFVETGGSENQFKEVYRELKEPYLILTYGENNSLAASMEILSFLKQKNLSGEILHGSIDYIVERIKANYPKNNISYERLGIIGKPSDWLISSDVNYEEVKRLFGIELVNISLSVVNENYNKIKLSSIINQYEFDQEELNKSYRMYEALKKIKDDYLLNGLTIRCFDLIKPTKTTGCMALALLNKENITATCEGDIPTMITMHVCNTLFKNPGFQANPSRIDVDKKEIVFAHCTLPLNMVNNVKIMTHFESKSGVAIRGELLLGPVTIFKIGSSLNEYVALEGELIENLKEDNLCRTQIKIKLEDVSYFLTKPLGNHHVIIYGHHKLEIEKYFKK